MGDRRKGELCPPRAVSHVRARVVRRRSCWQGPIPSAVQILRGSCTRCWPPRPNRSIQLLPMQALTFRDCRAPDPSAAGPQKWCVLADEKKGGRRHLIMLTMQVKR